MVAAVPRYSRVPRDSSASLDSFEGTICWVGPFLETGGFAEEARAFVTHLRRLGVPVAARSVQTTDSVPCLQDPLAAVHPDDGRLLADAMSQDLHEPVIAVVHGPVNWMEPVPGAALTVGRTMFETDGLPAGSPGRLDALDEIWVASHFNAATFASAGVSVPIRVVPGGIDTARFRPGLLPLAPVETRGTTFLSSMQWSLRKGWDVALRAWALAFGPDDDVSLVLHCAPAYPVDGDFRLQVEAQIDSLLEGIGTKRGQVAPIAVITERLVSIDLPRLYAAADAYLAPSRGEGWGRPQMEAMACGLPVLATRWSATLDFMDDSNSMLIDIDGLVPTEATAEFRHFHGQRWAEPSAAHLAHLMRRVFEDPVGSRELGLRASADIHAKWGWESSALLAAARLVNLAGALAAAPMTGKARQTTEPAAQAGRQATGPSPRAQGQSPLGVAESGQASEAVGPRIRWKGDVFALHSLAQVNRALCAGLLESADLQLEICTAEESPSPAEASPAETSPDGASPDGLDAQLAKLVASRSSERIKRVERVSVEVRHAWPPDFSPPAEGALVMIQPWEFGGIPGSWIDPMCNLVDEIWCPSSWVRECYVQSGIPPAKVHVVPNGVDTELFKPEGNLFPLTTTKQVKFLFVGGAILRKGIDVLLDAYLGTFRSSDDVCLVVKPFGSESIYRGATFDDRLRQAASDSALPAIELVEGNLTAHEMAGLYRACDVLVHPYRGEGFAMPVAEAMASGLPVIVTGYGACLDYCNQDNSYLIPAVERPMTLRDLDPSPSGTWWAEPDGAELRHLMRRVLNAPTEAHDKGRKARADIVAGLRWDIAVRIAHDRLVALSTREPLRSRSANVEPTI